MTDQRRRLTEFLGETDSPVKRDFLTWQDLGDVKEELVKKGLWEVFYKTTIYEYIVNVKDRHYDGEANMVAWLICPTDEKGAHFCRLVAEFLETRNELSGISEK